ncbi:MAG: PAS domain S-box protein [Bacteroidota bacterium]
MSTQPDSSLSISSLRTEIARLESLFENSSLNYQCMDSKGIIIKVNSAWLSTLGYSVDEVLNKWFGEFLEPKSAKKFTKEFRKLTKADALTSLELQIKCKDGSKIFADFSCLGTTINGENNEGTHCVFQNITKLRQTELALAKSEKKYSQLVELAYVGIFELDPYERRLTYVNDIIKQIFEINDEDLPTFKIEDKLSDEGRAMYYDRLERLTKGEKIPKISEYQIIARNKEKIWVQTNYSFIETENKKIRIIGVAQDITSRKNTEERYKALIESAASGISTMSKKGIVTSVNPRLCEISGYTEAEMIGKHFLKIPAFLPNDTPKYIKLYYNARKEIIPKEPVPFQWRHKDGSLRWGEAFLSRIIQDGKVVGYQSVLTDITNRVHKQEAEQERIRMTNLLYESAVDLLSIESEKKLYDFLTAKVLEILPDALLEISSASEDEKSVTIESVGIPDQSKYRQILKIMGNNLVGKTMAIPVSEFDYVVHERLFTHHQNLYDIAHGRIPKVICNQIEKIMGPRIYYEIPLGNANKIMGSAVIFAKSEIEPDKQKIIEILFREASGVLLSIKAAQKLNRNEQLYRSLAESTGDWIIRFNRSFEHIFVNQATSSAFKMKQEDFIGKKCLDLGYSTEYSRLIESKLKQTIKEQRPTQCDIELCIDNQSNFYEWCFNPELEEAGMVTTVLVNARNITQRKKMEAEMLDTLSKKNSLYSIISHDLRSPFNSVLGFLNLLDTHYPDISDAKKQKYIKIARDSTDGCLSLLNQLLEWSTDYNEKESIKPLYFDLKSLVNKVLDLHRANILEKKLSVANEVKADILVNADYNMIFTVLRNIVSNAIRFSNEHGIIIISALDQKRNVLCKVQDFGSGISNEDISSIFSERTSDSSARPVNSLSFGLGLKLSKRFVENNNGTLWIEGEPGKGTTVLFTLNK